MTFKLPAQLSGAFQVSVFGQDKRAFNSVAGDGIGAASIPGIPVHNGLISITMPSCGTQYGKALWGYLFGEYSH